VPIIFENDVDKVRLANCIEFAEAVHSKIMDRRASIYGRMPTGCVAEMRALIPLHCLSVCFDHLQSSIDAVKRSNANTPGALLRCTLEAYCRGVWLFYVKDEQLLQNFEDSKDTKDPERLIRELRGAGAPSELCDGVSVGYMNSKKALNSLVHNGFESIHWQADYVGADVGTVSDILCFLIHMCLEALAAMVFAAQLDSRDEELAAEIIDWKNAVSKVSRLMTIGKWEVRSPESLRS
jgi:hypothetical protein